MLYTHTYVQSALTLEIVRNVSGYVYTPKM